MKRIIFSLLALALTATLQLKAENTDISAIGNVVYMEPAAYPAGSQQTLSIKMKNTVGIQTVQFDMVLPEGVTVVKDEDDFALINLSTARTTVKKMDSFSAAYISGTRYRVLINSNGGYTFDGTDGEIVQVVVNIDAAAANTSLPLVIEDIVLVDTGSNGFETERVETTITVTEPVDNRVILDETSITVPEASNGEVEVLVKRTIKANEWSTICLPFSMTEAQVKEAFGEDVQLAEFMDYETNDDVTVITVTFEDAYLAEDGLMANYPYIIKVSQDVFEFSTTATIEPDEDGAVAEYTNGKTGARKVVYGTFYGTLRAGQSIPAKGLFLNNNKFWYSVGQTAIKGFRGYFVFDDVLASVDDIAGVKFNFYLNGEATRIEEMVNAKWSNGKWYDLSGRQMVNGKWSNGQIPKGVYVIDGKKVVK